MEEYDPPVEAAPQVTVWPKELEVVLLVGPVATVWKPLAMD